MPTTDDKRITISLLRGASLNGAVTYRQTLIDRHFLANGERRQHLQVLVPPAELVEPFWEHSSATPGQSHPSRRPAPAANCTECRLQTVTDQLGSSSPTVIFNRFSQILAFIITHAYVSDKRWISIQEQDPLCMKGEKC